MVALPVGILRYHRLMHASVTLFREYSPTIPDQFQSRTTHSFHNASSSICAVTCTPRSSIKVIRKIAQHPQSLIRSRNRINLMYPLWLFLSPSQATVGIIHILEARDNNDGSMFQPRLIFSQMFLRHHYHYIADSTACSECCNN